MTQHAKPKRIFTYEASDEVIDEVNRQVLCELQRDPRLTMAELGRRIGMSSPAVAERVRRMEGHGIIRGYFLDIDPIPLGLQLAAYIRVRPNAGQLYQIVELARSIPEVVECHRITGEDCIIMKVYFPAMDQLDRILDCFLQYGSTTTSIIQSSPVPLRTPPLSTEEPES